MMRLNLAFLVVVLAVGCGGSAATGGGGGATANPGTPRPGGAVDLLTLAPSNANVVLHSSLATVRQDPVRYDRIASQLASELGLAAESATIRQLLDRTDDAVGVFGPGTGELQEGMLVFAGRYADSDFEDALRIAAARHGSSPAPQSAAGGRLVYAMGSATLVKLDQWTWAVAVGPSMRAHLSSVALGGARFAHDLLEFGPRIGLPSGSTQAWANQDTQVGVDMVALVFAGENPQMVHNFVATVMRHLGL